MRRQRLRPATQQRAASGFGAGEEETGVGLTEGSAARWVYGGGMGEGERVICVFCWGDNVGGDFVGWFSCVL